MNICENLINKKEKISVIGLGYVGMPIAVAFAKKVDVIGFDLNNKKIDLYKKGVDPTNEVGDVTTEENFAILCAKIFARNLFPAALLCIGCLVAVKCKNKNYPFAYLGLFLMFSINGMTLEHIKIFKHNWIF